MSELRAVTEAVRQLREQRQPFLSATVMRVFGSGYRRAGARLIASGQVLVGSISGGCLERDVVTKGFWRTREQRALLVRYDDSEDALEERRGAGCQGVVEVLLEQHGPGPGGAADVFAAAERCIRDEQPATVLSVFRSTRADTPVGARLILQDGALRTTHDSLGDAGLAPEAERALAAHATPYLVRQSDGAGEIELLVECLLPPVHLFVFGSGHDAVPLVAQAKHLGWSVSVWDGSPRTSARERFSAADQYLTGSLQDAVARLSSCVRPAAVVMGHHLDQDRAALGALLPSRARYLGVLGPRARTEQMLADCRAAGVTVDAARLARLYAPVGLQLGAQTPAEIALAIAAEVQATLTHSEISPLRSQNGAIHRRAPAEPATTDASQ